MMVSNRGSVWRLVLWQWRLVSYFLFGGFIAAITHHMEWTSATLSSLPLAVIGGALGIFVSFRTNSAYARWWEGRKLWGRMINSSRHFATQVLSYFPRGDDGQPSPLQRELIVRHIAYVHMLRLLLRVQPPFEDSELVTHLSPQELAVLPTESNATHALLNTQSELVAQAARDKLINDFHLQMLDDTFAKLLDIQGGCERIKKTPMPRGYSFIAERLILLYGFLFPWVLVHEIGFLIIPINILVCLSFALISEAGRVLEDPFTMFWNGLPLSAISRMIEVNLRQRLGDPDLPPMIQVDEKGILM